MSSPAGSIGTLSADWVETRRRLYAYVLRRVGDRVLAEDITQEVIVRSIAAGALDRVDNPVAWLYRSASNAVIDHYRTRRGDEPLGASTEEAIAMTNAQAATVEDDERTAARELSQCLQPLIARLEPKYRDALIHVELEGTSNREAAEHAGVSVSGMKSRVQRARRQLRTLLTDCCTVDLDRRGGIVDFQPCTQCGCAEPDAPKVC